jgi:uncharacterized protein (TIGR03089 family)
VERLTAGLVPDRDLAQPLLTYLNGPARIELSGATTKNWVAKTANLLVDGYGAPDRVGVLLPLHWQTPCFVLGAVAAGATVVLASTAEELAGCAVAFTDLEHAEAALDVGVDDVLACSLTPFGTRLASVPPLVLDAAIEIPAYGDHFSGRPGPARLEVGGVPYDVPLYPVTGADRVLTRQDPRTPAGVSALLGPLRSGAALVMLLGSDLDLEQVVAQEGVTLIL